MFADNLISDLAELGATVKRASCGQEGMEFIKSNIYDGIILDLRLGERPDMQGLQILEWITKNKKNMAVIVVTGHQKLAYRALDVGVDGLFLKPVDSQHVLKSLMQAVELRMLKKENTRLKRQLKFIVSLKMNLILQIVILFLIFIWRIYLPKDNIGIFIYLAISIILLLGGNRISRMVLSFLGQKFEIDAVSHLKEQSKQ